MQAPFFIGFEKRGDLSKKQKRLLTAGGAILGTAALGYGLHKGIPKVFGSHTAKVRSIHGYSQPANNKTPDTIYDIFRKAHITDKMERQRSRTRSSHSSGKGKLIRTVGEGVRSEDIFRSHSKDFGHLSAHDYFTGFKDVRNRHRPVGFSVEWDRKPSKKRLTEFHDGELKNIKDRFVEDFHK